MSGPSDRSCPAESVVPAPLLRQNRVRVSTVILAFPLGVGLLFMFSVVLMVSGCVFLLRVLLRFPLLSVS